MTQEIRDEQISRLCTTGFLETLKEITRLWNGEDFNVVCDFVKDIHEIKGIEFVQKEPYSID